MTEQSPLVSVLVRTVDRPRYLAECLASIAEQTWPELEAVVVADGGPDVRDLIESFEGKLSITYVHNGRARGRSAAANLAARRAHGQLIAYLDDDDVFYPEHVATLVRALLDNPVAHVAYADAYEALQEPSTDSPTGYATVSKRVRYSVDFEPWELLLQNHVPNLCLVHRRGCLPKVGWFDEKLDVLEDWDLLIRLALHTPFVHVKAVTAEYRIRTDDTNTITARRKDLEGIVSEVRSKYRDVKVPLPASTLYEVLDLRAQVDRLRRMRGRLPHVRLVRRYPRLRSLARRVRG